MSTTKLAARPFDGGPAFARVDFGLPRHDFGLRRHDLLGQPFPEPSVDAMTAELRERITTTSNTKLIGTLLLRRR
jgi:hypothetical protein